MSQDYTEGSFVKTGNQVFRIDPRPYQAVVDRDQANHGLAQAQLEQRTGHSSPKPMPRSIKPRPRSHRPWPP